ncbi:MAG: ArsR/SmtB family transcription factor [Candidatus Bathyarchaeia archaeon]
MTIQTVKIIRDPKTIEVLADPVRKEIVRLIAIRPMTETQLAKKLVLTKPSVNHHLKILRNTKLIKIEKTEVGTYGILEKYYKPTACLFIEDWEKIPPKMKKHFLQNQMERLRGIIAGMQLVKKKIVGQVELTSEAFEQLAQEMAKKTIVVAKRYAKQELGENQENLNIKILTETLKELSEEEKWQNILTY